MNELVDRWQAVPGRCWPGHVKDMCIVLIVLIVPKLDFKELQTSLGEQKKLTHLGKN